MIDVHGPRAVCLFQKSRLELVPDAVHVRGSGTLLLLPIKSEFTAQQVQEMVSRITGLEQAIQHEQLTGAIHCHRFAE